MSKTIRFGLVALPLFICLFSDSMMAQGTAPPPGPAPQPQAPAQQQPPQGAGIPPTMTVAPSTPPPPKEPYVLEDGGFYIQPFYWLDHGAPHLRGGYGNVNIADLQFNGTPKAGAGVEIGLPAGHGNTLRVSAFRVQGNSGIQTTKDNYIFGEVYSAGDFLNATYKVQVIKASWDYLSYTWHKPSTAIHVKTLFEAQYVNTKYTFAAPFVAGSLDATGNNNLISGSKSIVLPTLGMAMGSEFGKYFRWDVRGSGFGFPHRGAIADVEATVAVRVSRIELLAGERLYYYKTSAHANPFATQTLQGVYGGLRFVWQGVTK